MAKILIAGAGGAPSEGVIKSILKGKKQEIVIGMGSEPSDLILSAASRKYVVPYANTSQYNERLIYILNAERPDLVHFQNDLEIYYASLMRDEILSTGTRLFMPEHDVIDVCVHKYKSWLAFRRAGLIVPENIMITTEKDLKLAFCRLANEQGVIWLRSSSIGGGGKGSIPTGDFSMAKAWIDHYDGWGEFIAASMLTPASVTWLSVWYEGELIVAQSRKRSGWTHGNRTISGVTGVTKVGVTCDDEEVTSIAIKAVKAVSQSPHGIFGVDMSYDLNGVPNPTEINISRFFTTVLFFTVAGLNMPEIFKDIAIYKEFPKLDKKINPLPNGLIWSRGMDVIPRLTTNKEIKEELIF